jgi:plastocyanin
MGFSLIFSAHAQVSIGNEIGTANLDRDIIFVSRHFDEQLKIYGSISDAGRGTKVTIHITDPNGDIDSASQQIFTTDVGYFETFKILNWESVRGTYTVHVSSNSEVIGSLLFVVQESDENPANIQTPKQTTHDTVLTLNLQKGTNPDSIQVFPKYTDGFGTELLFTVDGSEEFIEIYIDNQYVKSIKPNKLSEDITVGYGSHDAYAKSPEFTIIGSEDRYLSAKSNPQSIYLQSPTTSGLVAKPAATTPFVVDELSAPETVSVEIPKGTASPGCETSNACFSPASLTINVGDTVEWMNVDTAAHTVTSGSPADGPSGVFDSSLIMGNASFENTFDEEGNYDYFCMVHPWMVGNIQVN